MDKEHKCDTCIYNMPECKASITDMVFAIDIDPFLEEDEADRLIQCKYYKER